MRDERPRRRPARDGLHRRRLDLDKAPLRHHLAKRRDDLRPAQERLERLRVGEQVDITPPIALLEVGQPVPLFRRRQQALGQEGELRGEDGQLAGLGVSERAVHADQVAQVQQLGEVPGLVADLLLADEDLDALGPVAELEEDDLPLPAPEHDPAGHADGGSGLGLLTFRGLRHRQLAHAGDRLVPVEPLSPRIDPQLRRSAAASPPEPLPDFPALLPPSLRLTR